MFKVKVETASGVTEIIFQERILSIDVVDEETGSGFILAEPGGDIAVWPRTIDDAREE